MKFPREKKYLPGVAKTIAVYDAAAKQFNFGL